MPNRDGTGPIGSRWCGKQPRGRGLGPCGGGAAFRGQEGFFGGGRQWRTSYPAPIDNLKAGTEEDDLHRRAENLRQQLESIEQQLEALSKG